MRRDWPFFLALATVTIAVFARVVGHDFVNYDDYAYVTRNSIVQQGLTWHGVKWAFTELHGEVTYWHPLTWISHMLDCQLFGLKPGGHHFGNVVFHTFNTLLLFLLLRKMTGRRIPSAIVAALFALHPFQVDSVAWVAERKNLLSAFFWLLTLLAYVRYAERPAFARYALVFLLMAMGLMAKPTLVTLPCVMLLLDFWPLGRTSWAAAPHLQTKPRPVGWLLLEKAPLLVLSAASSVVTVYAHKQIGGLVSGDEFPLVVRLANAVVSYALYLKKVLWPVDLSVFYMHPGRWPVGTVVVSAVVLLAITAVTILQRRQRPFLVVGWLWFLGVLVPFIGLVQAHVQAMADRFIYVPIIGVFVMAVWAVAALPATLPYRKVIQTAFTGAALLACIISSSIQLGHWRDSITLMKRAVQVAGGNYLVHEMLGNALADKGELDAALAEYQIATQIKPTEPGPWQKAGMLLTQQGKPADAIPYLQKAIELAPAWPEPRRRLAQALHSQGRRDEARQVYLSLIPLVPLTAEHQRNLADTLAEGQQVAEAIHHYRQALRLKPDHVLVINNLAWLRATAARPEWRDGKEAVTLAEQACAMTARRNPSFLGTLAASYAEAGRFPEAVSTIQEAMTIAKSSGATALLPVQSQMLARFQAGRPFHEALR